VLIARCDLDSHADTCRFGRSSTILTDDLYNTANVIPLSDNLRKLQDVLLATIAVSYDCPQQFSTLVLIFHQVRYIETLTNTILCPNQLRLNDVTVNECPLQLIRSDKRRCHDHAIIIKDIMIPLQIISVTSRFNVRKPTPEEVQDDVTNRHIHVTNDKFWEPACMSGDNRIAQDRYVSSLSVLESDTYDPCRKAILRYELCATGTYRKGTVTPTELA
jgi:hypothetical protein